jgi:hypothetical protein
MTSVGCNAPPPRAGPLYHVTMRLLPVGLCLLALGCAHATAELGAGSQRYQFVQYSSPADTVGKVLFETTDVTTVTSYKGQAALLLVESSAPNGKQYLDSVLVLQRGLAPVWERYQYGSERTSIDYDGARVARTTAVGDSVKRVEHTYDVPVYHFAELDMIVRSVPLRTGYRAVVPLYSEHDDELEKDTVSVEGRGPDGRWTVRFADTVIVAHYTIDGATRVMVAHELQRRRGGPQLKNILVVSTSSLRTSSSVRPERLSTWKE